MPSRVLKLPSPIPVHCKLPIHPGSSRLSCPWGLHFIKFPTYFSSACGLSTVTCLLFLISKSLHRNVPTVADFKITSDDIIPDNCFRRHDLLCLLLLKDFADSVIIDFKLCGVIILSTRVSCLDLKPKFQSLMFYLP